MHINHHETWQINSFTTLYIYQDIFRLPSYFLQLDRPSVCLNKLVGIITLLIYECTVKIPHNIIIVPIF